MLLGAVRRRCCSTPQTARARALSSASTFNTQQRVVAEQLLRTVGSEEDLAVYEKYFAKGEQHLVVVKAGGEVIRDELDVFVKGLQAMKAVGLFPIVVHGGGPQMNQIMEEQGIEPQYAAGLRVTDEHVLGERRPDSRRRCRRVRPHARALAASSPALRGSALKLFSPWRAPSLVSSGVARQTFLECNLQLCAGLEAAGCQARPITSGVLQAEVKDPAIGFVGEITGMNIVPVQAAIDNDCIPVILPLAESTTGQILNVNADVVAREAAIRLAPLKTVFINSKGGWVTTKQDEPHAEAGVKLPRISMAEHYEEMAARDYEGRQGTLLKLNELKMILDALPPPASIALTSAAGLVKEIFPHRGVGTTVSH